MVKHRIKNKAVYMIPIEGKKVSPNGIAEVEITKRVKYLIKNDFFEDLGIVFEEPKKEAKIEEKEEEIKNKVFEEEKPMPKKKKGRKYKNIMEE